MVLNAVFKFVLLLVKDISDINLDNVFFLRSLYCLSSSGLNVFDDSFWGGDLLLILLMFVLLLVECWFVFWVNFGFDVLSFNCLDLLCND